MKEKGLNKVRKQKNRIFIFSFSFIFLIGINLLSQLYLPEIDLTSNRFYTLSAVTHSFLKKLNTPVTIYVICKDTSKNLRLLEIVKQYQIHSRFVKVKHINPSKNGWMLKKYEDSFNKIEDGSLIVELGNRYIIINREDMLDILVNPATNQEKILGARIEEQLTYAIMSLTKESSVLIYELEGHGEKKLEDLGILNEIKLANYEKKSINLLSISQIPREAKVLLVMAPQVDFSEKEVEIINNYLKSGGKAIFLIDVVNEKLTNFNRLFNRWGFELKQGILLNLEGTEDETFYIVPNYTSHKILRTVRKNNLNALFPFSQPIFETKIRKQNLVIEKILTTKSNTVFKGGMGAKIIEDPIFQKGDIRGTFCIGMTVSEKTNDITERKIVILGCAKFLKKDLVKVVRGNFLIFLSSLNWLVDQKELPYIEPKSLVTFYLTLTPFQSYVYTIIVVILIPLLIFSIGINIWIHRENA